VVYCNAIRWIASEQSSLSPTSLWNFVGVMFLFFGAAAFWPAAGEVSTS
jgi:hypothetical protein